MLLFSAIQDIEIALRTKMIHYCSLQFGAFWFMEQQLSHDSRLFSENFNHIKLELSRSKEDFILEHNQRYDNPPYPPAWKTLEVISFGTLSKLYNNLSDTFKADFLKLIDSYPNVDITAMGFPKDWKDEEIWSDHPRISA
jgi:abortive infection bacteriophage resistance protein